MRGDVRIVRATEEDAEEILALIKRAFTPVGEQYGDMQLPPLAESLDSHRARYDTHVVLKAVDAEGRAIGSIQGELRDDGTCYIGRLVVDPDWQGRGVGRALAEALEDAFPEATCFELFTGHLSEHTLRLYRSLGYEETRRERESDAVTLVWMRKAR
jgi:ribosomal protein S18 acetylase RimI-like enzyme